MIEVDYEKMAIAEAANSFREYGKGPMAVTNAAGDQLEIIGLNPPIMQDAATSTFPFDKKLLLSQKTDTREGTAELTGVEVQVYYRLKSSDGSFIKASLFNRGRSVNPFYKGVEVIYGVEIIEKHTDHISLIIPATGQEVVDQIRVSMGGGADSELGEFDTTSADKPPELEVRVNTNLRYKTMASGQAPPETVWFDYLRPRETYILGKSGTLVFEWNPLTGEHCEGTWRRAGRTAYITVGTAGNCGQPQTRKGTIRGNRIVFKDGLLLVQGDADDYL